MHTYEKVYKLVKKIPKGKVATYGQIGQVLDLNPRVVGWALNRLAKSPNTNIKNTQCPESNVQNVPWQRVINSQGKISTNKLGNIPLDLQKKLLEAEGIDFNKQGTIDLEKYKYKFRITQ